MINFEDHQKNHFFLSSLPVSDLPKSVTCRRCFHPITKPDQTCRRFPHHNCRPRLLSLTPQDLFDRRSIGS